MKNKSIKTLPNLRVATVYDFKPNTHLITNEGYVFVLYFKYGEDIWEARGEGGGKCIFESEAHFYKTFL